MDDIMTIEADFQIPTTSRLAAYDKTLQPWIISPSDMHNAQTPSTTDCDHEQISLLHMIKSYRQLNGHFYFNSYTPNDQNRKHFPHYVKARIPG